MRKGIEHMDGEILKLLNSRMEELRFAYAQKCDSFKNMTDMQLYGSMYPANAINVLTAMQDTRVRIDELSTIITIIEALGGGVENDSGRTD